MGTPASDADVAQSLITYLEDRSILHERYAPEFAPNVVFEILEIQRRLAGDLEKLDRSSPLFAPIESMRAACGAFVDAAARPEDWMPGWAFRSWSDPTESDFFVSVDRFRSRMGLHIARMAVSYRIDVEGPLTTIFPADPGTKTDESI